jgi:hypothetical protein
VYGFVMSRCFQSSACKSRPGGGGGELLDSSELDSSELDGSELDSSELDSSEELLRNHQTGSHYHCAVPHSHQQRVKASVPLQKLLFSIFKKNFNHAMVGIGTSPWF